MIFLTSITQQLADWLDIGKPWPGIILLAAAFVTGFLLSRLIRLIIGFSVKKGKSEWAPAVQRHLQRPLSWLLPITLSLIVASGLASEQENLGWLVLTLKILFYVVIAWTLIQSTDVIGALVRRQYDLNQEDNLHSRKIITQLQFIKRLVTVVVFVLTAAIVLMQFESVRALGTGLLTSAGVAGIIIGFAAQKSLANLLAGFQIAFTQPMRLDDAIIVEGEWGQVEEITLTYVVVRIWDKRRLVLPLNYFIEKPFQNWTRTSADLIGVVYIYTDYQMPVEAFRPKLAELLEKHPLWDQKIKAVQVTDCKADVVETRLLMGARNAPQAFDLRCDIREAMIKFIREEYPESLPRTRMELQPDGRETAAG